MRKAYPTDLNDEQWAVAEPLIAPAKPGGRQREVNLREVLNTLFYRAKTGCQWNMLPHDLLPKSTVHGYLVLWESDGTWQRLLDAVRGRVRQQAGRAETPSAGCIDSQTVKTTAVGGERGYDGGKKINGRKRHIVVDTMGLLLAVVVTSAAVDDGRAAPEVLRELWRGTYTRLKLIWADSKYHNHALNAWLKKHGYYEIEVIRRPKGVKGFYLLPRRWVVERTFAWFNGYRGLSKDYEYKVESSQAMIKASMVHLMLRKLHKEKPSPEPRAATARRAA
jgi:putative transposase